MFKNLGVSLYGVKTVYMYNSALQTTTIGYHKILENDTSSNCEKITATDDTRCKTAPPFSRPTCLVINKQDSTNPKNRQDQKIVKEANITKETQ